MTNHDREKEKMAKFEVTRRQFTAAAATGVAAATLGIRPSFAQSYGAPELIEAAKKEGKIVYYTADFTEPEQEIIKGFNKRFPFVRVEMVRAPGGQLITRIKTEAAAGKLAADVVNHSDRGLMQGIQDLFQEYTPPNAKDYREDVLISTRLWPKAALGWSIAYNTELMKNPPKSWMDLTKPEYGPKLIGQVIAPSGGTTWTRIMFERQVLGEDYWKKQAATQPILFPSGAPTSDALVRGEISIGVLLYNIAYIKKRDGAPVDIIFPSDGVPLNFYAAGVTKTSANPNAGKLFLNWCLSDEGQAFQIKELGYLTALKNPPFNPPGYDPKVIKPWAPNFDQYVKLRDGWVEEWNKTYGYRQ
jgi:iron(III) transport system substrate-binding protein